MIINSLFMGLVVYLSMKSVSIPALKLLIGIPVGFFSYFLLAYVRKDDSLYEIMSIIKKRFSKE